MRPIQFGYQDDEGNDFNVEGYILHPHNLLETWIVFTNLSATIDDEDIQDLPIVDINLKNILEKTYNEFLPGLRVLSTRIYYLGPDNRNYQIGIDFSGQGILNTQTISIKSYSAEHIDADDKRVKYAREFIRKLI